MDGRFTVGASVVREGHEGRRRDEALEAREVFHMYQRKAMSESPKTSLVPVGFLSALPPTPRVRSEQRDHFNRFFRSSA